MNSDIAQFDTAESPGDELLELAVIHLEGHLTDQQRDRLNTLLATDPTNRDRFVALCAHASILASCVGIDEELDCSEKSESDCKFSGQSITGEVATEPTAYEAITLFPVPSTNSPSFVGGPVFSYMVATMVLCAMLLSAWAYKVTHIEEVVQGDVKPSIDSTNYPRYEVVGYVTGVKDCVWAKNSLATMGGASVPMGRKYELISGLMEINYNSGARVILEGPCNYTVDSDVGGRLQLGKLVARVEKNDELGIRNKESERWHPDIHHSSFITHNLFSVRTPTATITDLGTEFGVEVNKDGDTISHVFQGSVRVEAVGENLPSPTGRGTGDEGRMVQLGVGDSARVDCRDELRVTVLGPSDKVADFIREIPTRKIKTFDLVDVVAGGDGFSGRRDSGIDLSNGQITNLPQKGIIPVLDGRPAPLAGDGKYHHVTGTPFIDGVFIPDGDADAVQVDSAGHVFKWFRDTSNTTWRHIWAGAASRRDQNYLSKVADVDYASFPHGDMLFHANAAITFDLEVIRRANPGAKLLRFRATAANNGAEAIGFQCYADVLVLIDAKRRFQRRLMYNDQEVASVSVPIHDRDRFLTLAATDAGDGISHDWIIFGDPRLEMSAGESGEQSKTEEVQP